VESEDYSNNKTYLFYRAWDRSANPSEGWNEEDAWRKEGRRRVYANYPSELERRTESDAASGNSSETHWEKDSERGCVKHPTPYRVDKRYFAKNPRKQWPQSRGSWAKHPESWRLRHSHLSCCLIAKTVVFWMAISVHRRSLEVLQISLMNRTNTSYSLLDEFCFILCSSSFMVSLLISFSIIKLSEVWVHLLMHDIDFYPVPVSGLVLGAANCHTCCLFYIHDCHYYSNCSSVFSLLQRFGFFLSLFLIWYVIRSKISMSALLGHCSILLRLA
jgi:hypothetical protein